MKKGQFSELPGWVIAVLFLIVILLLLFLFRDAIFSGLGKIMRALTRGF